MAEWVEPAVSPMRVAGLPAFAAYILVLVTGAVSSGVRFGPRKVPSGQPFPISDF
jgi:hypothetical protein